MTINRDAIAFYEKKKKKKMCERRLMSERFLCNIYDHPDSRASLAKSQGSYDGWRTTDGAFRGLFSISDLNGVIRGIFTIRLALLER